MRETGARALPFPQARQNPKGGSDAAGLLRIAADRRRSLRIAADRRFAADRRGSLQMAVGKSGGSGRLSRCPQWPE